LKTYLEGNRPLDIVVQKTNITNPKIKCRSDTIYCLPHLLEHTRRRGTVPFLRLEHISEAKAFLPSIPCDSKQNPSFTFRLGVPERERGEPAVAEFRTIKPSTEGLEDLVSLLCVIKDIMNSLFDDVGRDGIVRVVNQTGRREESEQVEFGCFFDDWTHGGVW